MFFKIVVTLSFALLSMNDCWGMEHRLQPYPGGYAPTNLPPQSSVTSTVTSIHYPLTEELKVNLNDANNQAVDYQLRYDDLREKDLEQKKLIENLRSNNKDLEEKFKKFDVLCSEYNRNNRTSLSQEQIIYTLLTNDRISLEQKSQFTDTNQNNAQKLESLKMLHKVTICSLIAAALILKLEIVDSLLARAGLVVPQLLIIPCVIGGALVHPFYAAAAQSVVILGFLSAPILTHYGTYIILKTVGGTAIAVTAGFGSWIIFMILRGYCLDA